MRSDMIDMGSTTELSSNQFTMCDSDIEMSPGIPCDHELKFPEPVKHEFDLVSDVVDSEMSKMTQEEKTKFIGYGFPEDPRCWTTRQLIKWINSMIKRFSIRDIYTTVIQANDIDGAKLCSMTETEFKTTFPDDDVIFQCLKYWKEVPVSTSADHLSQTRVEFNSYEKESTGGMNLNQIIREAMMPEDETETCDDLPSPAQSDSGYSDMSDCYQHVDRSYSNHLHNVGGYYQPKPLECYDTSPMWGRAPNPLIGANAISPPHTPVAFEAQDYRCNSGFSDSIKIDHDRPAGYYDNSLTRLHTTSYQEQVRYHEDMHSEWSKSSVVSHGCTAPPMKIRRKGPGRPPKPESEKKRKKVGRWQPLLWEYILRCLDGEEMAESREMLEWVDRSDGLFKFFSGGKESFAQSWGEKKGNRKIMTYQKMARALRDYAKKNIIVKYKKKLHYKFTSDETLMFLKTNTASRASSFVHQTAKNSVPYRKGEKA
ncbi:uncharacterized protein LOC144448549 [Glandiceps talaboti]